MIKKTVLYIAASLIILGVASGSTAIVLHYSLATKVEYIEKDSLKMDNLILDKLKSIDDKLSKKCN